jgi:hypothetical protein
VQAGQLLKELRAAGDPIPLQAVLDRDGDVLDLPRSKLAAFRAQLARHMTPEDFTTLCQMELLGRSPLVGAERRSAPDPDAAVDAVVRRASAALNEGSGFLEAPAPLDLVAAAAEALGYAGGLDALLLTYLACTSRLLPRPVNVLVAGPSAAGKTFTVETALRFLPQEAFVSFTATSERALLYIDIDLRHRMVFLAEAEAFSDQGVGVVVLRELASNNRLRYQTVESTPQGLHPRQVDIPGPTGLITTSTGPVDRELDTRLLKVDIPDTPAATAMVLRAAAERAKGTLAQPPDLQPLVAGQLWLHLVGRREAVVPFADRLKALYPAAQVRARRDFPQLLALIQAHALLCQRRRAEDERGRVVATLDDYAAVHRVAGAAFSGVMAAGCTPAVRETVQAVAALVGAPPAGVSVAAVAKHLGLDHSAASRRVHAAMRGGWLVNDEPHRNRPALLRVGDPLPRACVLLSPAELGPPPPENDCTPARQVRKALGPNEELACRLACSPAPASAHQDATPAPDAGVQSRIPGVHASVHASKPKRLKRCDLWRAGVHRIAGGRGAPFLHLEDVVL